MAIKIELKKNENLLADLAKVCDMGAIGTGMAELGYTLSVEPKALRLWRDGKIVQSVQMNTEALVFLLEGKLATHSKAMLVDKIKTLLAGHGDAIVKGITNPAPAPAPKKIAPLKAAKLPDVLVSAETVLGGIAPGPKVLLTAATELHQPVASSSGESLYHTVALSKGVNAAARIKVSPLGEWSVSFRLEGPNLPEFKPQLVEADIGFKDKYASQHLHGVGGKQFALRTLGALLLATGIPFTALSTTPSVLINKGA